MTQTNDGDFMGSEAFNDIVDGDVRGAADEHPQVAAD